MGDWDVLCALAAGRNARMKTEMMPALLVPDGTLVTWVNALTVARMRSNAAACHYPYILSDAGGDSGVS